MHAPAASPAQSATAPAGASASPDEPLPPPAAEAALPEAVRAIVASKFTGDLDAMVTRRLVRIGRLAHRKIDRKGTIRIHRDALDAFVKNDKAVSHAA